MKKDWKYIVVGAFLLLLIGFGGNKIKERIQIKNLFDEMYYSEIDYVKNHKATGLPMMKEIENIDRKHIQKFDELTMITESYKKEYVKKNEEIIFSFGYSSKTMSITCIRELDKETVLQVGYDYDVKKKILNGSVGIALNGVNETSPNTKEEIQEYLDKYHITTKELQKKADELLYDTVIKDWVNGYDSRFSADNLGEVTIEKDSFLEK